MPPNNPLFTDLPDHANEQDDRQLAIDKVGIKGLSWPIRIRSRDGEGQHTVADVNLYVSLPHNFKGTHMSRFIEVLNGHRGEMTLATIPALLETIQRRLDARDAHLSLRFPYFLNKKAPVSGVSSMMEYICSFEAAQCGEVFDFVLGVEVPVKSLCPCSKSISRYGAHNQRSIVRVQLRARRPELELIWIEDVIERVEKCASAPLYALLKREDEKYITELAYENPRFVEDLVREVVISLREIPGVCWMSVSAENQESIHNHSAYGQIEWSLEDENARQQMRLALPTPNQLEEPESFGAWLSQQRVARGYQKQQMAGLLGVSPSHYGRVEADKGKLSEEPLARLAEALGLDAVDVQLRGGCVPHAIMERIQADPAAFRRWAEG